MFALATGVSEYFDNRWYASVPIYSLALLDGFSLEEPCSRFMVTDPDQG